MEALLHIFSLGLDDTVHELARMGQMLASGGLKWVADTLYHILEFPAPQPFSSGIITIITHGSREFHTSHGRQFKKCRMDVAVWPLIARDEFQAKAVTSQHFHTSAKYLCRRLGITDRAMCLRERSWPPSAARPEAKGRCASHAAPGSHPCSW